MKILDNEFSFNSLIPDQSGIFVQGGAATPTNLLERISKQSKDFSSLEFYHLHIHGNAPHKNPQNFKIINFFVGANIRKSLDYDRIDYLPCFLSEIPKLLKNGFRKFNVAFIHVSTPDEHGFCSLGLSVDVTLAAIKNAKIIIAQVNKKMPRTHGDGVIHISQIDFALNIDEEIEEVHSGSIGEAEKKIGDLVANLIDDGSTLQMGIGTVPDAVLSSLIHHKNLGVHTEMFSNGLIDLIEKGVVNNSLKKIHPFKTVAGFAMGNKRLYDFVSDNPSIVFLDISYVNHPNVIKRNPKVMAINSAVQVDLTGQVCADSIGPKIISGVGGQMDFMRGAALSEGGKPILALTSRSKNGESRIVTQLNQGAGVVTTRQHVHYIVTEFGVANLYGKTFSQRIESLINIAHPDDRDHLFDSFYLKNKNN